MQPQKPLLHTHCIPITNTDLHQRIAVIFFTQVKALEVERDELRGNVDDMRASLESETLQKVDYQNNVQSLKEELDFLRKVHQEVRRMGLATQPEL